jgi:chemotaxis signal transduction protein
MADLAKSTPRGALRRALQEKGPVREFLAFALGRDLYGVELTRVREILSPPPMTEVPRAPRGVLGICSVRGLLVTVVDLRRRLDLPESAPTRRTRVLLTKRANQEVMGVLVDEVKQVVRLGEGEIELATAVLGGEVSEHVLGIGRPGPGDDVIILLDLATIVGQLSGGTG